MKSPVGVSLYQHSPTRSNPLETRCGRMSFKPARSLCVPSAGIKLARDATADLGGAETADEDGLV